MALSYEVLKPEHSRDYRRLRLESLQAFPQFFTSNYAQQLAMEKLYFERLIEAQTERGTMVGAFDGAVLIGICGLMLDTDVKPAAGEIIQMYVNTSHQGKGVGLQLIRTVLELAKQRSDISSVVLEVMVSNVAAIATYQKAGFVRDDSLPRKNASFYMSHELK